MTTHECRTCCHWSELIAKTRNGVLAAVCLNSASPRAWRYVIESHGCEHWVEATDGAVDAGCQTWPASEGR